MQLLYKTQQKVKELKEEQLSQAYSDYPLYYSIIDIVNQFRRLIFDKNVRELENWIKLAKGLRIREIDSFVNGIKKGLEAVKNAIIYDYNNGLAEGSVNKLKVIKRIMYGRCDFQAFFKKSPST